MKILLFTLEYPPFHGGIASYYGNLVKYWPKARGIEILNNNQGELINTNWPLGWLKAVIKLRRTVREKKISQVLVGQILPLGTVALINSKLLKTKYSVILHGLDFTNAIKSKRKRFISRKILAGAEKIICSNNYVAGLTARTFPEIAAKIAVVNPGAENLTTHSSKLTAQLKEKYNLSDKITLLSVGRLVKRKGFDKVIEALPAALKAVPNLIYVIIGDGEEMKNYESRIMNYGLEGKVIIINQASDDERDAWYDASDIFIMPSRNINGDFEGFGIVYLEANLAGKPVIAGRSGGAADAVIDGLNGLLVNPEDNREISNAIVRLARDSELRRKLGERGRERSIKEFSWEKQAEKIYKLLI